LFDCFKNWFEDKTIPTPIAAHICWFIWLERNQAIFEETTPSLQEVIYKTLALQNRVFAPLKDRPLRDIMIPQQINTTLAWSDGVAQLDGISCGAGGVIKTPDLIVIRWIYNCGRGTNTRGELMGAWATLMLADYLSLHRIQVMVDSRVVID